ncbi:MAG: coenzyme F420-0:L-glutamate ligase [Dehalococcoidia bacterium]|nr:coenzyme F420-0:L-glutamate ligase [Dehalococcoidia bacterium]MDW8119118.1 coenzyme F420-0:L-glutamate ligase [Chloroflexota bacterium]
MPYPAVHLIGISGIPEVRPGDDLAYLIVQASHAQGTPLHNGDVVVITQKIVSKAEGRLVDLGTVEPSPFARHIAQQWDKDPRHVEVVLRESRRIVRMDRGVIICETHHGFICANAGVDASNIPGEGVVSLLPQDPDASARRVRQGIRARAGVTVAVIISDTFGRPWREGTTNVAIGVAGMEPLVDYRGRKDTYGKELRVSIAAVADEIASAADLVMGKTGLVPVVIVRGYPYQPTEGSARALLREPSQDMFR